MDTRARFAVLISVVAIVAVALGIGGVVFVNRTINSPDGVVRSYFAALASEDAASARALPGVVSNTMGPDQLVLLQTGAFVPPKNITVSPPTMEGNTAVVEATYLIGEREQRATFSLESEPAVLGVFNQWRFSEAPLGRLNVTIVNDTAFQVGDLGTVDVRSYDGGVAEAFAASATFPVFVGTGYDVYRSTSLLTAPRQSVLVANTETQSISVEVAATPAFVSAVQENVDVALTACLTQKVLMPTGCPFGYATENRWVGDASWSLATQPVLAIVAGENGWLASGDGVAHLTGSVQSLFDGSEAPVDVDVDFHMDVPVWVTGPDSFSFSSE